MYEPIFCGCSYGFRPGRSAHDAVTALHKALYSSTNAHVVDVDLADFYGSIEHDKLLAILRMRIKDEKFVRVIARFLKNGHEAESNNEERRSGIPQGSIMGPILANIYAHYCIDKWFQKVTQTSQFANMRLFRFADDLVAVATSNEQARAFKMHLEARLTRCALTLHPNKTQVTLRVVPEVEKQESIEGGLAAVPP